MKPTLKKLTFVKVRKYTSYSVPKAGALLEMRKTQGWAKIGICTGLQQGCYERVPRRKVGDGLGLVTREYRRGDGRR